ncbi:MAG: hypothetical protein LUH15_06145 [Tannerellaceae bacterium]|nr:hypothetical protein [Tannerellaceae bacterium]
MLYHAKVQKFEVKPKYAVILEDLAQKLNFHWYKTDLLKNNIIIGEILKGFYQAQGYYYEDPIDKDVYKNISIIKQLPQIKKLPKKNLMNLKIKIARLLPKSIIRFLKKLKNNL